METILKIFAITAVTLVLCLILGKQHKEYSAILSLLACVGILLIALQWLKPVMDFVNVLQSIGNLDTDYMRVLLKATGIGMVAQIACLTCQDAGFAALGKAITITATAVILCLSLPMFRSLISLLQEILSEI